MKEKDPVTLALRMLSLSGGKHGTGGGECPGDELFGAFMDGKLRGKAAEAIRKHLALCPLCRTAAAALDETREGAGPPVPEALLAAVRDRTALLARAESEEAACGAAAAARKKGAVDGVVDAAREKGAAEEAKAPAAGGRAAAAFGSIAVRILAGALEVLEATGLEISRGLEAAAVPVRSGTPPAPAGKAELVEMIPSTPLIERITLQKVDPGDVRITILPENENPSVLGGLARADLLREGSLVQSWPLEPGILSLEPVTAGRYRLRILETDPAGEGGPRESAAVDIDLRA